jgi:hypothetical protein
MSHQHHLTRPVARVVAVVVVSERLSVLWWKWRGGLGYQKREERHYAWSSFALHDLAFCIDILAAIK